MEQFAKEDPVLFAAIVVALAIWSLAWKGLALWRAAQMEHKKWFIALLVINTVGILEILYLYVFSKRVAGKNGEPAQSSPAKSEAFYDLLF